MPNITQLRKTIGSYLGYVLTPEIAAEIEIAASHVLRDDGIEVPLQEQDRAPTLIPPHPTREQIERLENFILQGEQVDAPTKHYFSPGLYSREMFIPAGTVLTGAVHKTEHLCLFVGDITVWTEEGMKRLTGHHTFISKPGAKRVGYAHTDTWCTGFFPTSKTDVAEIEAELCESPQLLLCNRLDRKPQPVLEK